MAALVELRSSALLANPLLESQRLLLVKRRPQGPPRSISNSPGAILWHVGTEIGMPSNHECNSSLARTGYDNELAVLAPIGPRGALTTLYRPGDGGYVGEVDLTCKEGVVYLHDVYAGRGLQGVPRGTIKGLRVLAYHYGYRGLAGPDKIGYGGPWEVMRILGTVPLEADGSALFRVPANTPVAVQALDAEGKAVQWMRSWFTAMPGEKVSCTGCHESPADAPARHRSLAAGREPRSLTPWYGPPRGFSFQREVQPVLDKFCVECHDGRDPSGMDLRAVELVTNYAGRRVSDEEISRLHWKMRADTKGIFRYAPAYDALIAYLRRVGIEDDVSMLVPGEYHADTSPLVQMLRKGHQGVQLDAESWDRLVTWIDLNAPCHGAWGEVYPIPDRAHQRRMTLRKQYGGPEDDPEAVPDGLAPARSVPSVAARVTGTSGSRPATAARDNKPAAPRVDEAAPDKPREKIVDPGNGLTMRLVLVPAGEFSMGDAQGEADESPVGRVRIPRPFWMGACEVSNEQYRAFDPGHDPRYYARRHARDEDQGLPLNGPQQPVVRVSWEEAMRYCRWLVARTGMSFRLPTEAQWEWACRAGSRTPLSFGDSDADFSKWANLADRSFSRGFLGNGRQSTGMIEHLVLEGAGLSNTTYSDRFVVTAPIGSFQPNAWGLQDLHGNAAEWTLSSYRPYPYRDDDGRNDARPAGRKVVRGGSFFDNPQRFRSSYRSAYPYWQRVFNVGFRVVAEEDSP